MKKQRAVLEGESEPVWQGKCGSVSGGRFGVCIQGSRQRRFSIGCRRGPAHETFPFRDGGLVQLVASKLSAGTLEPCHSSPVTHHSSLVTSSLERPRLATSCGVAFRAGAVHARRAGTCRRGANLNNCGQRVKKARLTNEHTIYLPMSSGQRASIITQYINHCISIALQPHRCCQALPLEGIP